MPDFKCQLCSKTIAPEKKRFRLTIRIQPDQDEDVGDEDSCSAEECLCSIESALQEKCFNEFRLEEKDPDFFQEMQLVICEPCQVQFSKNPFMQECLLFISREAHPKTIH